MYFIVFFGGAGLSNLLGLNNLQYLLLLLLLLLLLQVCCMVYRSGLSTRMAQFSPFTDEPDCVPAPPTREELFTSFNYWGDSSCFASVNLPDLA